jgi:polyphosphate kinase
VGGLKRQKAAGVRALSADGRTPTEQLALIAQASRTLHRRMTDVWETLLKPALREKAAVEVCHYDDLDEAERATSREYFTTQVYPILTPLAVDPGRPFPFISNLSLSLAVITRHPQEQTTHFARVKVPANLPRWFHIDACADGGCLRLLPVEEMIAHHIGELFCGMELIGAYAFRITRNADLSRDEEEAEDLLAMISEELRRRRFAPVVRMEVTKEMPAETRWFLMEKLELGPDDVYEVDGLLDLTGCFEIADLDLPQFRFEPWEPGIPSQLSGERQTDGLPSSFAAIRQGDLLIHHPYDSFAASVQRLVENAAVDEHVLAIKQTIYRTSDESPIVQALIRAAENGKQVAVLVEVKARFDEASNIEWGRQLENAGVHVAYGLVGLKIHAKATLIVRKESDGLRTYCHIGTGNYHPKTAHIYTDLGLLTCSPELGHDLVNLFHYLTGYSPCQPYQKVMVAPRDMRNAFYDLFHQEIAHQQRHGNGRIICKMNALDDVGVIKELYRASQAGVQIDLIVRAHCALRPGVVGYSENIRVVSILGRFLEHSRIFYFHNNAQPLIYIGSADWRRRNLQERVELITPVQEPHLQDRLIQILECALDDNYLAWDLDAEGQYVRRRPQDGEPIHNSQEALMTEARQ